MIAVFQVLYKSVTKAFYQENVGYFLVTLGLVFGFLKTPQHIDIASFLAVNPIYYVVPFGLSILYGFKVIYFFKRKRRQMNYTWMNHLTLLGVPKLWLHSLITTLLLNAPVLAYTCFLFAMAIRLEQSISIAILSAFIVFAISIPAMIINRTFYQSYDQKAAPAILRFRWMPNGIVFHYLQWLLTARGGMLIVSKLFSLSILVGGILIFQDSDGDKRLLFLALLLCIVSNAMLAFYAVDYEQQYSKIFMNLPLRKLKRFSFQIVSILLILIPEFIIMLRYFDGPITLSLFEESLVFAVGLFLLLRNLNYLESLSIDRFAMLIFFLFAFLFFVILGYVSPFIIGALGFLLSYCFYQLSRLVP